VFSPLDGGSVATPTPPTQNAIAGGRAFFATLRMRAARTRPSSKTQAEVAAIGQPSASVQSKSFLQSPPAPEALVARVPVTPQVSSAHSQPTPPLVQAHTEQAVVLGARPRSGPGDCRARRPTPGATSVPL